jgi:hypothetical protein
MPKARAALRAAAASVALIVAIPTAANATVVYDAPLTALNNSGVTGLGIFTLNDSFTTLTVQILADGLEPNANHVGHIHGLFTASGLPADSTTPTPAQDTDGDGYIELAEGLMTYGPIILSLVPLTDPGPDVGADGVLDYFHVFNLLDPSIYADNNMDGTPDYDIYDLLGPNLDELQLRELVLHGMIVPPGPGAGTPGEVNGTNGYLDVLPVASGEIKLVSGMGAVPEPATWAMMLIGFGAIGSAMRRRKSDRQFLRQLA